MTNVYTSSFSITQPDFTANCLDAKQAGATFIYFAGDGDSLERMANDCAAQGYNPLFVGDSIAITANLTSNPNLNGLFAGQTDFPWVDSYTPAQATYQQAVKQYDPGLAGSATTAAEWTAGMLAVAAASDLTATPPPRSSSKACGASRTTTSVGSRPRLTFNTTRRQLLRLLLPHDVAERTIRRSPEWGFAMRVVTLEVRKRSVPSRSEKGAVMGVGKWLRLQWDRVLAWAFVAAGADRPHRRDGSE